MSTAHSTDESITDEPREPLRLTLAPGDAGPLDGVWWPQSRDLQAEVSDLVDHFPEGATRIVRATFSPPDWEEGPKRVSVRHGYINVGSSPHDDTHVMMVRTSDRRELCLLVVPPSMPREQAQAALDAAVPGYAGSAAALLAEVREIPTKSVPASS